MNLIPLLKRESLVDGVDGVDGAGADGINVGCRYPIDNRSIDHGMIVVRGTGIGVRMIGDDQKILVIGVKAVNAVRRDHEHRTG